MAIVISVYSSCLLCTMCFPLKLLEDKKNVVTPKQPLGSPEEMPSFLPVLSFSSQASLLHFHMRSRHSVHITKSQFLFFLLQDRIADALLGREIHNLSHTVLPEQGCCRNSTQ